MLIIGSLAIAGAELIIAEIVAASTAAILVTLWDLRTCR